MNDWQRFKEHLVETKYSLSPPVEREWERLRSRLRRKDALDTAAHVSEKIRDSNYPLWYSCKVLEYLLKRGELQAAEMILKALQRSGASHPLVDDLRGRWLWSFGNRAKAIRFTKEKAKHWSSPFLYKHLAVFYRLVGDSKAERNSMETARLLYAQLND